MFSEKGPSEKYRGPEALIMKAVQTRHSFKFWMFGGVEVNFDNL